MSTTKERRWMTVPQVCKEYCLSRNTVYRMIDSGELKASYLRPQCLRVSRDSMEALIERNLA